MGSKAVNRIVVAVLALCLLGGPALAEREEAERVVRLLIDDIADADPRECPEDLQAEYGTDLICADFDATFSSFKFLVRQQLQRMAYEQIEPTTSWRLKDGIYIRAVEVDTTPMTVAFDEKNRHLYIRFDKETPEETPADRGDPQLNGNAHEDIPEDPAPPEPAVELRPVTTFDGPFFSGLGGASRPVVVRHSRVLPDYPDEAIKQQLEGSVTLEAYVLGNGTVGRIDAVEVEPEGQGFAEAAVAAVEQWRFQPGARDGTPVDVFFTLIFEFRLEEE